MAKTKTDVDGEALVVINETPPVKKEPFLSMSVRMRESRVKALHDAKDAMPYRVSLSALVERAIDLLVADLKAKGEING